MPKPLDAHGLSSAVWQGGQAVRDQISQLLDMAVATGEDPLLTAKKLEQFLDPSLKPARTPTGKLLPNQPKAIVTRTPGRGGMGSFPARRLARTEMTASFGDRTLQTARSTAWVDGVQWNLSRSHPEIDECDDRAQGGKQGDGVYPKGSVPDYPAHPQCLCFLTLAMGDLGAYLASIKPDPATFPEPGPEPGDWAPAMSSAEAEAWLKGSQFDLVLYRGGKAAHNADIAAHGFDATKAGVGGAHWAAHGQGFYFSPDEQFAGLYGDVQAYAVKIRNALVYDENDLNAEALSVFRAREYLEAIDQHGLAAAHKLVAPDGSLGAPLFGSPPPSSFTYGDLYGWMTDQQRADLAALNADLTTKGYDAKARSVVLYGTVRSMRGYDATAVYNGHRLREITLADPHAVTAIAKPSDAFKAVPAPTPATRLAARSLLNAHAADFPGGYEQGAQFNARIKAATTSAEYAAVIRDMHAALKLPPPRFLGAGTPPAIEPPGRPPKAATATPALPEIAGKPTPPSLAVDVHDSAAVEALLKQLVKSGHLTPGQAAGRIKRMKDGKATPAETHAAVVAQLTSGPAAAPNPEPPPPLPPAPPAFVDETAAFWQGKAALAQYAAWKKTATPEAFAAADYYKGSGFIDMNAALRGQIAVKPGDSTQIAIDHLAASLDKTTIGHNIVVYRGVKLTTDVQAIYGSLKPGDVVTDPGFMSTSLDRHTAEEFSHIVKPSLRMTLELEVPKTARGLFIQPIHEDPAFDPLSPKDGEVEVLLQKGTSIVVTKVTKNADGSTVVHAKVLQAHMTAGPLANPTPRPNPPAAVLGPATLGPKPATIDHPAPAGPKLPPPEAVVGTAILGPAVPSALAPWQARGVIDTLYSQGTIDVATADALKTHLANGSIGPGAAMHALGLPPDGPAGATTMKPTVLTTAKVQTYLDNHYGAIGNDAVYTKLNQQLHDGTTPLIKTVDAIHAAIGKPPYLKGDKLLSPPNPTKPPAALKAPPAPPPPPPTEADAVGHVANLFATGKLSKSQAEKITDGLGKGYLQPENAIAAANSQAAFNASNPAFAEETKAKDHLADLLKNGKITQGQHDFIIGDLAAGFYTPAEAMTEGNAKAAYNAAQTAPAPTTPPPTAQDVLNNIASLQAAGAIDPATAAVLKHKLTTGMVSPTQAAAAVQKNIVSAGTHTPPPAPAPAAGSVQPPTTATVQSAVDYMNALAKNGQLSAADHLTLVKNLKGGSFKPDAAIKLGMGMAAKNPPGTYGPPAASATPTTPAAPATAPAPNVGSTVTQTMYFKEVAAHAAAGNVGADAGPISADVLAGKLTPEQGIAKLHALAASKPNYTPVKSALPPNPAAAVVHPFDPHDDSEVIAFIGVQTIKGNLTQTQANLLYSASTKLNAFDVLTQAHMLLGINPPYDPLTQASPTGQLVPPGSVVATPATAMKDVAMTKANLAKYLAYHSPNLDPGFVQSMVAKINTSALSVTSLVGKINTQLGLPAPAAGSKITIPVKDNVVAAKLTTPAAGSSTATPPPLTSGPVPTAPAGARPLSAGWVDESHLWAGYERTQYDNYKAVSTKQELAALKSYKTYGYTAMNQYMRGMTTYDPGPSVKAEIANVAKAIDKAEPLRYNVTGYRNVNLDPNGQTYKDWISTPPGGVIEEKAFMSVSTSLAQAQKFGGGSGAVRFTLEVPAGTKTLFIDPLASAGSSLANEKEILMQRGTKIVVYRVDHLPNNNGVVIYGRLQQ